MRLSKAVKAVPDAEFGLAWDYLCEACPWLFREHASTRVSFAVLDGGEAVNIRVTGDLISIRAPTRNLLWRGLGRALGLAEGDTLDETPAFSMIGMMLDNSRNAVLSLGGAKQILAYAGLMGINTVMLYTEDTYEVPGEPWFGYLRGAWSQEELRALDDHAHAFGIELMPCIQTLGHLEQMLQWPAYAHLRDTDSVLLADAPETYGMLKKMICAVTEPLRSTRIHLGMDEAMGLGTGIYKQKNGVVPSFELLMRHLGAVTDICRDLGLQCMIWSDMFFRLGSEKGHYYDEAWICPDLAASPIPGDVQLVYWDYYHFEEDEYTSWIERHRELGVEPVMATGIWTWNRMCTGAASNAVVEAAIAGARNCGLQQVFATMWGDDGAECDVATALPALLAYADRCYDASRIEVSAEHRFSDLFDADIELWRVAASMDLPPALVEKPERSFANFVKTLLWDDPIVGLFCSTLDAEGLADWYDDIAGALACACASAGPFESVIELQSAMGRAVAAKLRMRSKVVDALEA